MKNRINRILSLMVILLAGFACQVSKIETIAVAPGLKTTDGAIVKYGKKSVNKEKQKVQSSATRVVEGDVVYLTKK